MSNVTKILVLRATPETSDTRGLSDSEQIVEALLRISTLSTTHTRGSFISLLFDKDEVPLIISDGELDLEAASYFSIPLSMSLAQLRTARIGLFLRGNDSRPKLHAGPFQLFVRREHDSRFLPFRRWPFSGWLANEEANELLLISLQGRSDSLSVGPVPTKSVRKADDLDAVDPKTVDPLEELKGLGDAIPHDYPEGGGSIRA